jgi:hypothetical protein
MAKLAAPSGFRDFLPEEFRKRRELLRRIRETYEAFGFEGMDTPAVESLRVMLGKGGGENEKLMFHVLKRGADLERALAGGGTELSDMALRFDLTVPLARYYASHRASCRRSSSAISSGPCGGPSGRSTAAIASSSSATSTCWAPRRWPSRPRSSSRRRRRSPGSASRTCACD